MADLEMDATIRDLGPWPHLALLAAVCVRARLDAAPSAEPRLSEVQRGRARRFLRRLTANLRAGESPESAVLLAMAGRVVKP